MLAAAGYCVLIVSSPGMDHGLAVSLQRAGAGQNRRRLFRNLPQALQHFRDHPRGGRVLTPRAQL